MLASKVIGERVAAVRQRLVHVHAKSSESFLAEQKDILTDVSRYVQDSRVKLSGIQSETFWSLMMEQLEVFACAFHESAILQADAFSMAISRLGSRAIEQALAMPKDLKLDKLFEPDELKKREDATEVLRQFRDAVADVLRNVEYCSPTKRTFDALSPQAVALWSSVGSIFVEGSASPTNESILGSTSPAVVERVKTQLSGFLGAVVGASHMAINKFVKEEKWFQSLIKAGLNKAKKTSERWLAWPEEKTALASRVADESGTGALKLACQISTSGIRDLIDDTAVNLDLDSAVFQIGGPHVIAIAGAFNHYAIARAKTQKLKVIKLSEESLDKSCLKLIEAEQACLKCEQELNSAPASETTQMLAEAFTLEKKIITERKDAFYKDMFKMLKLRIDSGTKAMQAGELTTLGEALSAEKVSQETLLGAANSQAAKEFKASWKEIVNLLEIPSNIANKLGVDNLADDRLHEQINQMKNMVCNLIAISGLYGPTKGGQTPTAKKDVAIDHIGVICGTVHPRLSIALGLATAEPEKPEDQDVEEEK